jgi:hypothetical protein
VSSLSAPSQPAWERSLRVSQLRVLRSEWTKLISLRSTLWSLFAAVLLTVGLPALFAAVISSHWTHMRPAERGRHHPLDFALAGVNLSQLAIGVLGVLVVTGEYSTGMIRSTIAAVPKRLPVLWAKVGVFAAVSFGLMLPSVLAAFFISQAIIGHIQQLSISLSDPGVTRAVIGGALYATVFGVFALALGAITRSTAAGIAALVAIFFVIPPILDLGLPTSWENAISPYLPSSAGRDIFALTTGSNSLSPWAGFALFVGYTALALAVAGVLLVRRDA